MFELPFISSGSAWLSVADAVAKATIVFATAGILSFALRRGSAAARHMVWTLALIGVLVLPALSLTLPRWQIALVKVNPGVQLPAASSQLPAASSPLPADRSLPESGVSASGPAISSIDVQPAAERNAASSDTRGRSAISVPVAPPDVAARGKISWPALLLVVWAVGAALVLGRLAAGIAAVQWMSRRVERVSDAPWLPQAHSLAKMLGVSPRIAFFRSGRAVMPMAWGIFRPAVLMPADADAWPGERLRIVLLHELAHVKRRDCLTHMLAQVACAFHWFNPLAWIAARHARTERERACDDLVLAAGTRGPDYATQLIEIARVMRSGRFPAMLAGASLAMAHRSELEGRLMSILDPHLPRAGVSRLRTAAATTMFTLAVMPLASMQPWSIGAADSQAATARQESPRTDQAPVIPHGGDESTPEPDRAAPPQMGTQRAADTIASSVLSAVQSSVHTTVHTSVVNGVQSGVETSVGRAIGTAVHSALSGLDEHELETQVDQNDQSQENNRRADGAQSKTADPRMVAALTAALKDTDKEVRETALHALVQLRDPGIFEPLVQALADAAPDVREQAASGLGQLRDRRAVEPLTNALKDSNADVREQAAFALGQLRDRSAVPGLTAALKDADEDVREQAVFALGQMRDPASVDALIMATRDAKANVREQAVFALGQIRDRRAVETLISGLKDADADVREQSAFALGQIRDRGAVEALVIALKDSVADVREQAAFALGQLRDARAIDGLTSALKDASADVRQQAAFALGQLAR
jgi:HEAT repeat protein/beta-lactamase regulating signal transducer with metallopeptidase domain